MEIIKKGKGNLKQIMTVIVENELCKKLDIDFSLQIYNTRKSLFWFDVKESLSKNLIYTKYNYFIIKAGENIFIELITDKCMNRFKKNFNNHDYSKPMFHSKCLVEGIISRGYEL